MITRPNVKINLGLRVLRRREDSYHDLETLFLPYFGLHDTLEIIPGDGWSETSADLFASFGEGQIAQAISDDGKVMITIARREGVDWDPLKDLTFKAYRLLVEDWKLPPVKIFLQKTSPVGAGLGGGSADAAFALRMLSEIAGLELSDSLLASYAARLGSDCPFFIYNRPMLGEGRGEILTDVPDPIPSGYRVEVVVPEGVSVSTAEAYKGIRPYEGGSIKEVLSKPIEEWKDLLVNDFEKSVFPLHPELAALKNDLYDRGAVYASMSGSGSALFGIFPL